MPAHRHKRRHHVVARREASDPVSHLDHDARAFVPADSRRHGRQPEEAQGLRWRREPSLPDVFVGVAEPGGGQSQQNFAGSRRVELKPFNGPPTAVLVEDGRAASHRHALSVLATVTASLEIGRDNCLC
jgi:hypothetical protein